MFWKKENSKHKGPEVETRLAPPGSSRHVNTSSIARAMWAVKAVR